MDKVVHFEIPFDDANRAQIFYKNVFGWQINAMPNMDYYIATTTEADPKTMMPREPGAINGGMLKRDPTGTYPILVIAVSSIDETLKKIAKSGGQTVLPKMKVGDFGYYARISDTEGNIIGIWEMVQK
jgi:predicted enzyme related to lactoylglutathione lyase